MDGNLPRNRHAQLWQRRGERPRLQPSKRRDGFELSQAGCVDEVAEGFAAQAVVGTEAVEERGQALIEQGSSVLWKFPQHNGFKLGSGGRHVAVAARGWGVLDSAAWSRVVRSSRSRVIASEPDSRAESAAVRTSWDRLEMLPPVRWCRYLAFRVRVPRGCS